MANIVMLCGYKRSGKDTVGGMLEEHGYTRLSFASTLKMECGLVYDLSKDQLCDQKLKEQPLLNNPVLSTDGTSAMFAGYFLKEFRFADGSVPTNGFAVDGKLLGAKSPTDQSLEQLYWTPRAVMIFHGATCRFMDPNHWVDQTLDLLEHGKNFVITDARFKSEIARVKEIGKDHKVTVVRILREEPQTNDPSERDLDGYPVDRAIINQGSLEELNASVKTLLEVING